MNKAVLIPVKFGQLLASLGELPHKAEGIPRALKKRCFPGRKRF